MARARVAALMVACITGTGVLSGGCAAPGARPAAAQTAAAQPVVAAQSAAAARAPQSGDDWRSLPPAPFGTHVQDLAFAVHEVLLFHDRDDAGDARGGADRECFAPDAPPRRRVGGEAGAYLLCFGHGRLDQVEMTLQLPAGDAAARFAGLCDAWQSGTVAIRPRSAAACDGLDPHGPAFRAVRGEPAQDPATDGVTAPMSITVYEILPPDGP